jgi:uncharacterized protein
MAISPTLPLIHINDIEEQPSLLRNLCLQIPTLPKLSESTHPILFVAEGSDYNAVAWQLNTLQNSFPQRSIRLMHPWELSTALDEAMLKGGSINPAQLIVISGDGNTTALKKVVSRYKTEAPEAPQGFLISNDVTHASDEALHHLHLLPLEAGVEEGGISSKTFTATAYLIHAMFFPNETLAQMDIISIGLATLLQTMPFHPDWVASCELLERNLHRPIVMVTTDALMPIMPEVQRKLSQSFGVPVSFFHIDAYTCEAQFLFHPTEQEGQQPLHLLFAPESLKERLIFEASIEQRFSLLQTDPAQLLPQLWINANTELNTAQPELSQTIPNLTHKAEMTMHSFMPTDLMVLAVVQRLACEITTKQHATRVGVVIPMAEEEILIGENTVRTGNCTQCGECCKNLYLRINKKTIETVEEFKEAQERHPDEYRCFEPTHSSDVGLVFKCKNLGEDDLCTDYENRPGLCRSYPTEDSATDGAKLPKDCGFAFSPLTEFNAIMQERSAQGQKLSEFAVGFLVEGQMVSQKIMKAQPE